MALTEDQVLVELYRAAALAGRPSIAIPSLDLEVAENLNGRESALKAISRLAKTNRITSVRKDLLLLPDPTGRITVGIADLIDTVSPQPYLITGGRALEHHDLTDQHFFAVAVLVPSQVTPFAFRSERARFLVTNEKFIWGWGDDRPQYATPERAVLDVLNSARFGVSFSQALSSLNLGAHCDPKFLERLAASARRLGSDSASRRIGLIVDTLFGSDAAAPFVELIGESRTPVLLRRGGVTTAPIDSKWRVIVNASTTPEIVGSK